MYLTKEKSKPQIDERNLFIRKLKISPIAQLRIVCFPNAGAGASVYRRWSTAMPDRFELCAIQLPGREDRFRHSQQELLCQYAEKIAAELSSLNDKPTVLFGHSMGALLAYETMRCLEQRLTTPSHVRGLYVSGRGAPNSPLRATSCRYDAPDAELLVDLDRMGGTPQVLLKDSDFMNTYLPILRADYRLVRSYRCSIESALSSPIWNYASYSDTEIIREDVNAWKNFTNGDYHEQWFEGGHFYLFNNKQLLQQLLKDIM
jgi:surfactin synthase thioesterase subunit